MRLSGSFVSAFPFLLCFALHSCAFAPVMPPPVAYGAAVAGKAATDSVTPQTGNNNNRYADRFIRYRGASTRSGSTTVSATRATSPTTLKNNSYSEQKDNSIYIGDDIQRVYDRFGDPSSITPAEAGSRILVYNAKEIPVNGKLVAVNLRYEVNPDNTIKAIRDADDLTISYAPTGRRPQ